MSRNRIHWLKIILVWFGLIMFPITGLSQGDLTPITKQLVNAIRSGGIPAAAALVGHYIGSEDRQFDSVEDLDELAQHSDAVARISVVSKLPSQLSNDKLSITTDYVVRVVERFQGPLQSGEQTSVRLPGGRIQFSNNTIAETWSSSIPTMQVGDDYVFFLHLSALADAFEPTLGPQGIFTFSSQGITVSRAKSVDEVYKKYDGMPKENFLQIVRVSATP
jgi:hypothetical protein